MLFPGLLQVIQTHAMFPIWTWFVNLIWIWPITGKMTGNQTLASQLSLMQHEIHYDREHRKREDPLFRGGSWWARLSHDRTSMSFWIQHGAAGLGFDASLEWCCSGLRVSGMDSSLPRGREPCRVQQVTASPYRLSSSWDLLLLGPTPIMDN